MSQNFLNIIGNWGTAAQQGRQRAKAEQEMALKQLQVQTENRVLEEQNKVAAENRISNIYKQAEALTTLYRPQDKEGMIGVEKEARAKLQAELNKYGDDVYAFMRAGGREFINEYRDSVLNSDEALIIKANHKALFAYLDQADKDASLISDIDVQNYKKWQNGSLNKFEYSGPYAKIDEPSPEAIRKELESGGDIVSAYLHHPGNYEKYLENYLKDSKINFGEDGRDAQSYYQELLLYVENKIGAPEIEKAKVSLTDETSKVTSYSKNLNNIFGSMNGNFQGDFNQFYTDPQNNTAIKDLESIAWIQPFNINEHFGNNKNHIAYSRKMFIGQELDIAKEMLPVSENGEIDFYQLMQQQANLGPFTIFNEQGAGSGYKGQLTQVMPGEYQKNDFGFWNAQDNFTVNSIELMFEVEGDDGKKRLLTINDATENSDLAQKFKKPVMGIVLRDDDNFLSGKDDFRYVTLDLNNQLLAKKLDTALGKIQLDKKVDISKFNERPYRFEKGKEFRWTANNVNNLVPSLHPGVAKVFKNRNLGSDIDITKASLIMATSMLDSSEDDPYLALESFATSQDKQVVALVDYIRDMDFDSTEKPNQNGEQPGGGLDGYFEILRSYGATPEDITNLDKYFSMIMMGYYTYGPRAGSQEPEEKQS